MLTRRNQEDKSEMKAKIRTYFQLLVFFFQTIDFGFKTWFARIISSFLQKQQNPFDNDKNSSHNEQLMGK